MYTVGIDRRIDQMISLFYYIGLWHDKTRIRILKWILTSWHLLVYGYYPFSLVIGALICEDHNEAIFLGVMSIIAIVAAVRLFYFVLKKDEMLRFVRKMGVHVTKDSDEFDRAISKINNVLRFVPYFVVTLLCAVVILMITALPVVSTERRFPLNIYFPLDWRNNELYYWIIYTFVSYELFMSVVCTTFTVIIWYLMIAFVLEYEMLGTQFRNLECIKATPEKIRSTLSSRGKQNLFLKDLILLIKKHKNLQE